ncbi:hypothetical protein CDAR_421621 [Caerostris darwini]|uniref:Uncharacterized protein n=1 Tax=Caerostris darwini TaxID=1538125 RepID=A0AAV4SWJ5_9ARAC|nr:hypothetical protein CDAR_421621 [Caerostris darwini]
MITVSASRIKIDIVAYKQPYTTYFPHSKRDWPSLFAEPYYLNLPFPSTLFITTISSTNSDYQDLSLSFRNPAILTFPPRHIRDYSKGLQLLAVSQVLQDLFTATTIYERDGLQIGVREFHPMDGLLLGSG